MQSRPPAPLYIPGHIWAKQQCIVSLPKCDLVCTLQWHCGGATLGGGEDDEAGWCQATGDGSIQLETLLTLFSPLELNKL